MPHLICYDISKNNLRNKIANAILNTGLDRINKSVYLGTISKSSLTLLENNLLQLISLRGEPQDSLIIIPVQPHQIELMRVIGENELDKEELKGTKTTLLIQSEEVEDNLEAEIKQALDDLESPPTSQS